VSFCVKKRKRSAVGVILCQKKKKKCSRCHFVSKKEKEVQ
jgi:hypothetical protein